MHYNNPGKVTNLVDASGINIYRTNQIRATQSGMFLVGTMAINIPAQQSAFTIGAACGAQTTKAIPATGITAYASFMHAHQRGRRIWSEITRDGNVIGTLGNNQNYDFNLQKVQSLTPTKLLPNDSVSTFCTFNTMDDTSNVTYGETTDNEMCFNFVAYYPLLGSAPTFYCGISSLNSAGPTACALLPGDPPPAYSVTGWTTVGNTFKTGGTARCNPGFTGTAVLGCTGNGAPFTFAGCVRENNNTAPPPVDIDSSAPASAAISASLLILSLVMFA